MKETNLKRIRELTLYPSFCSLEEVEMEDAPSYVEDLEKELNTQKKTLEMAEKEIERLKTIITKFLNKMMENNIQKKGLKNVISKR